jgi:catechol-2,3-dioxygenase
LDFIALFDLSEIPDALYLHWGLTSENAREAWKIPEPKSIPVDSVIWNTESGQPCAIHSKFQQDPSQTLVRHVHITLTEPTAAEDSAKTIISFVLFERDKDQWHNNNGKNYHTELSINKFRSAAKNTELTFEKEIAEYLET